MATRMTTRTRWQGWTLIDEDGNIVLDGVFRDPFVWKLRVDAEETKDEGQRVVRCELRLK